MTRKVPPPPAAEATDWVSIVAEAVVAVALLTILAVGVGAAPSDMSTAAIREQALQEHRERVAALLEERRQERIRETQQMEGLDEEGATARRETQREAQQAAARETTAQVQQIRGTVQLLTDPLNVHAEVGEPFLTGVVLKNLGGTSIDHIRVGLSYEPDVIEPVRISDHRLRSILRGEPVMSGDPQRGVICYSASLEEDRTALNLEVLTIEWAPVVPTPRSRITLVTQGPWSCAVTSQGQGVLGERRDNSSGVIGTEFAVRPAGDVSARDSLLIDDVESLQSVLGVRIRGEVGLHLEMPDTIPRVGDIIPVDVVLDNEANNPIDSIRFALAYDPEVFEVLDAAPTENRSPGANWIVGGVNLHDAPFRDEYRYSFLLQNEVDNNLGRARYHMGLDEARVLPSGIFARLYLRALAPAQRTAVAFLHSGSAEQPVTAVSCLGVDLLGDTDVADDGTQGLLLPVEPSPVGEDSVASSAN